MTTAFSRRDALKLIGNMGVATFAGGAMLASRPLFAQQATAVLGHFGSANPQTMGKANGAFSKALGGNVKTDFVTVTTGDNCHHGRPDQSFRVGFLNRRSSKR